jgi:hypothetical protein
MDKKLWASCCSSATRLLALSFFEDANGFIVINAALFGLARSEAAVEKIEEKRVTLVGRDRRSYG